MTAKIFNLNHARKQRARAQKEIDAEAARRKFGRSKIEKQVGRDEKKKQKSHLDGHHLDGGEPNE